MSSVRISELPLIRDIDISDVIVINEDNLVTSGITVDDFTRSFLSQDLVFTGDVVFQGEITANDDVTINGEAVFNNNVVFKDPVLFDGTVTITNFDLTLDGLTDVVVPTPNHRDLLTYNKPFRRWENIVPTYISKVEDDVNPKLGGNLDTNGKEIFSQGTTDIILTPAGVLDVRGNGTSPATVRLNTEDNSQSVEIRTPTNAQIGGSYVLTLPTTNGLNGQVLATDGSGTLYWTENNGSGGGGGGTPSGGISLTDLSVQNRSAKPGVGGELVYNNLTGQFTYYAADISGAGGGGGGGGIDISDLSVNVLPPNDAGDLFYDNTTGEFFFTPADLSPYLEDIKSESIFDLKDVKNISIADGEVLIWDNSDNEFKPGPMNASGGGATKLNELTDVSTAGVQNGNALVYDAASNEWIPGEVVADIPNVMTYRGTCNLTVSHILSDNSNVPDDPTDYSVGDFWINTQSSTGTIHPDWTGIAGGTATGLEYVAWMGTEFQILGNTGTLDFVTDVQGGTGIDVDSSNTQSPIVKLEDTTVTPGTYSLANVTVDQQGRITDIGDGSTIGDDLDIILDDYALLSGATFVGDIGVAAGSTVNFEVNTLGVMRAGALTYPVADGNADQVLVTDGSGSLYFKDIEVSSKVHVGITPPPSPEDGDLWINEIYELYVYDGSWVQVGQGNTGGGGVDLTAFSVTTGPDFERGRLQYNNLTGEFTYNAAEEWAVSNYSPLP